MLNIKILLLSTIMFVMGCEAITTAIVVTKTLIESRRQYCDKTSSSVVKAAAIKAIRKRYPGYPESGVCTKFGKVSFAQRDSEIAAAQQGEQRE